MFKGIVIDKADGTYGARMRDIDESELPPGDVTVDVQYSTLNYKDGLAITGKGPVVRSFPMVPGIDLVGTVSASDSAEFSVGQTVLLNGWGGGETHWGGLAQLARLKGDWLIPLPKGFDGRQAMAIGTAGYTAALCVDALEDWGVIRPGKGEVLVTGAAGGVGSTAVSLLSSKGYTVVASTGRAETHDYLRGLGAASFIDRAELSGEVRPLQKERWSGAVDSVGSNTLANVLAQTVYGGAVAACGLAGGANLPGTVMPHILRAVTLIGVDSVFAPLPKRRRAWQTLADHLDKAKLAAMTEVHEMKELPELAGRIVAGQVRGRVVIRIA